MRSLREHPRQRELCGRDPGFARQRIELRDQRAVGGPVLGVEARHIAADVVLAERRLVAQFAAERPAPDRRERDESDSKIARRFEHRDFGLAGPQRVFGLHRGHRMHGMRLANMRGAPLGHAVAADLARLDRTRERTNHVGNRNLAVEPVHVEQVDVVGLQPRQALVERAGHRFRRTVDPAPAAVLDHDPGLAREQVGTAPVRYGFADQRFVAAEAVDVRGVEVVVAELDGTFEQADLLVMWWRIAIGPRQVHAAQAHGVDLPAGERALFHHRFRLAGAGGARQPPRKSC